MIVKTRENCFGFLLEKKDVIEAKIGLKRQRQIKMLTVYAKTIKYEKL